MAVQITTEKSQGNTSVTVPAHPEFAESLRAARSAGIIGADVFTGKMVKGRVLPMNKGATRQVREVRGSGWRQQAKDLPRGAQGACRSCRLRIPASAYGRPASSRLTSLFRLTTDDFRDARLGAFDPSDAGRPGQTLRRAAEAASRSKSCRILGTQICSAS
jgi:hypothetical protein